MPGTIPVLQGDGRAIGNVSRIWLAHGTPTRGGSRDTARQRDIAVGAPTRGRCVC